MLSPIRQQNEKGKHMKSFSSLQKKSLTLNRFPTHQQKKKKREKKLLHPVHQDNQDVKSLQKMQLPLN
jgi:hypothetical protein